MSASNHPILDEYTPTRPPLMMMEKTVKWKPSKIEIAPNCPRCSSSNTKFCYYNNYSVSQPRYFCKSCRRYWTKGGSLRNVPIGGGCRKTGRSRSARPPSVDSETGRDIHISSNLALSEESAVGDQFRQVQECIDSQDFVYQNFDGFGVEGVFSSQLWSEGTNLLQEFEVFSSDEQLRMSANLVSADNWGSFDLSGYEDL